MKKIYLGSLLLAAALSVNAQSKLDLSVVSVMQKAENEAMANSNKSLLAPLSVSNNGVKMARVIVSANDATEAFAQLSDLGAEISDVYGSNIVCYIPVNALAEAGELQSIKSITMDKKRRALNDKAREGLSVDVVRAGTDLPQSYTGKDVVIGLFDMGLDPNHVNFRSTDQSELRVKRVWKYTGNSYTGKITTTTYSTETAIGNFTTDDTAETHGTHVLGIATGAYTGGSTDYSGMAPGADIAIACGDAYDSAILGGVQKIIDYAASVNKPCVINLSLGSNCGHHDGTDSFNKSIDTMAAQVPICIAAGNEGQDDIVVKKTCTADDTTVQTFLVPSDYITSYSTKYQATGNVEIISSDNTAFDVQLALYNKSTKEIAYTLDAGTGSYNYVGGSQSGYTTNTTFTAAYSSTSYMGIAKGICSDNNRYYAYIDMDLINKSKTSNTATYYPCIIIKGVAGKTYEIYSDGYTEFSSRNISGFEKPTHDGTISDMACTQYPIIIGAWCTKNTKSPYNDGTVGDVLSFSSWGTLADGRQLPHVCAPGMSLISSMSTPFVEGSEYDSTYYPKYQTVTYNSRSNYWTHMGGTSMATPAATGVVALWLEADPTLTPAEIRDIAINTATVDSNVTNSNVAESPVQWGAGKLNALAGIKYILGEASVGSVFNDNDKSVIVTNNEGSFSIYAAGETQLTASLIDMAGRTVATASANGDSVTLDANNANPAIYVLVVSGAHTSYSSKVVVR